jgi:two-component system, sensor histidine kinase and response regulator
LLQLREEALELREDMSNMIVHDLRTPLTTIVLAAGMINKYGDRAGQRALIVRKAGQILDSATQLEKMIDSLLFMAKLESGKILFNPIPTDLHYLGAEVIADFELIANSREIELRSELPNLGENILIDATILRRIIDNLMSNALKFSPVGGHVTLSLEYLPESRFRVKVADTGTGISEAERQKIFQKFEIGSLKKNVSQTGLGLAFCKMAVEAQGGTLAIADNHPQGVIFIVEI